MVSKNVKRSYVFRKTKKFKCKYIYRYIDILKILLIFIIKYNINKIYVNYIEYYFKIIYIYIFLI